MYSKTSLNRLTMGPTLSGPIREVVDERSKAIVSDPDKGIGIGEWSICGGDRFERLYCIYIYIGVSHM